MPDIKYTLTADEQRLVAGLKRADQQVDAITASAKEATRAIAGMDSAVNTHGGRSTAQISARMRAQMDPAMLTSAQARQMEITQARAAERAMMSASRPALIANRDRIREAFERGAQREVWADSFATDQRAFQESNAEKARMANRARITAAFEKTAWDGSDWENSNRRSNREALARQLRARRRGAILSNVAGGAMVAGGGILAAGRFAEAFADENVKWAEGGSAGERDFRPLMSLGTNVDRQGAIRRQTLAQAIAAGVAPSEAAKTLYDYESDTTMFDPATRKKILNTGLQLSRVTDSTAGDNLKALIKISTVYGDSLKDLDAVASQLLKTTETGSVTMKQLSERLPDIAPAFASQGYSLQDALAATAVGSVFGGRWEDTATDTRIIGNRMWKAQEAGLVTPGASFAQQMGELQKANLSTPDLMKMFGEDALSLVRQLMGAADQLQKAANSLASAKPGDLAAKVSAYERDPMTARSLATQRLTSAGEAVLKGLRVEGNTEAQTSAGNGLKAVDLGYLAAMDAKSAAFQSATGTSALSKLAFGQMFKRVGFDITAQASLQASQEAGGDPAAIARATEDFVRGGTYRMAMENPSWLDRMNHRWEGGKGPPDRPSGEADVAAWKAAQTEQGWAAMPWAVFQHSEFLKESGKGDPQAFMSGMKRTMEAARAARPASQSAAAFFKPGASVFDSMNKGITGYLETAKTESGEDSNRYKAALQAANAVWQHQQMFPNPDRVFGRASELERVTSTMPAFAPDAIEDQMNRSFIDQMLKDAGGRSAKARKEGRTFDAEAAAGELTSIRSRRAELTMDDGRFSATDARTLVAEIKEAIKPEASGSNRDYLREISDSLKTILHDGVKARGDGSRPPMQRQEASPANP